MTDILDADIPAVLTAELLQRGQQMSQALLRAEQQVLTGPRTGRIYHRPGGGTYQASAPGEPPAERTGALRASWQPIAPVITRTADVISVTTGIRTDGVPYATRFDPALQPYIGGPAPRPFVGPILDMAAPAIEAIAAALFTVGT